MQIKICGCRGSLPTPGRSTLKYGGNTTCLEIRSNQGQLVIIDAGSGLHKLGNELVSEVSQKHIRFFFTHSHWDHLMGFPFFPPAYRSDYTLRFCSGPHSQDTVKNFLSHQMQAPFFPLELDNLNANMIFHCDNPCHEDRVCNFDELGVKAFPVNHPNGGFGYRIIEEGKVFAFAPDNELDYHHEGGPDPDYFVDIFRGVDLLIHDSQYNDEEYKKTRSWGHSTFNSTVDLAIKAGVKRLGLFHHDPDRTDEELDEQLAICQERIRMAGSSLDCFVATEGMTLTL
ncbi:MAG: MBL fold metallo-hydrolase [Geobacteraceae bacterium]|nr:MBL fold metallo-hydrolase [Geobacteraceae bacterium]